VNSPDHEQLAQEDMVFPWLASASMSDYSFHEQQHTADYLDAMADRIYELEEAMREAEQDGWTGVFNDEISNEERYACDHYNERYVIHDPRN
jgi:hypothetical protein